MRILDRVMVTTSALIVLTAAAAAEPPAAALRQVERDELVALGTGVRGLREYQDNAFLYQQRAAELRETAAALQGGQLEFAVVVARVTPHEVIVEPVQAGPTRLVLEHAVEPRIGNLRTVRYWGPASTRRLHLFSQPVGLRIGSEIEADVAHQLRRFDQLVLRGRIAALPVWIESIFNPSVVAVIADWQVVAVKPQAEAPY